jgi:hypothetical protein
LAKPAQANLSTTLSYAKEGIVAEQSESLVRREVRSPRSAAIAGILFALLRIISLFLISSAIASADSYQEWFETWSSTSSIVLLLVVFSGIAFLWFTGVIRDRIGDREDRFFATIFLGSGILYVGMGFVWAAILGAILGIYTSASHLLADNDIYIFGFAMMDEIMNNFALRMAGVYMTSINTLWARAEVMPRWLIIITYIVALGFLFFAERLLVARYFFPAWVFLVSVYILILNYRSSRPRKD